MGTSSTAERGRASKIRLCRESHSGAMRGVGWEQLPQDGKRRAGRGLGFPQPARAPGASGQRSQAQDVTRGVLCRAKSWT